MKPILGLINHAAAVNDVLIVFRLGKSLSNSRFFHSKQRGEIFSDGVVFLFTLDYQISRVYQINTQYMTNPTIVFPVKMEYG